MKHRVILRNGISVPALGQGTWRLGDSRAERKREIECLRKGIKEGMTLIDTAEMYGNGRSEDLVGEAVSVFERETLYLVSKVLPSNAGGKALSHSLDNSLKRLGVRQLDLYLYHWRGHYPLQETVDCLEEQRALGKIKAWGVSNFDTSDMKELWNVKGGENCMVNQVLYHTASRGIEFDLIPWLIEHEVTLMSYCPLAQAGALRRGILQNKVLSDIANQYSVTVAEVMLAWNIRNGNTIAIPKSSDPEHAVLNARADRLELKEEDLEKINKEFPAPNYKTSLDIE